MRRNILISVMIVCTFLSVGCPRRQNREKTNTSANEVRAVSLKVLQEKLRNCQPKNSCAEDVLQLGYITRPLGVVVDEDNKDLILFGQADPNLPPLHVEDFVIALRNACMKYAPLEGDTYIYSYPGCSIDPDPQVNRELQTIERQMPGAPAGKIEVLNDAWRRVCQNPQKVRVLGIPFDTRFAQIMVKADYDMKTLVDGSDSLDTPGFTSLVGMRMDQARSDLFKHSPGFQSTTNRFWFYPGDDSFVEDQGVILIKQCPVKLLTEQMYTDARGEMIGGGRTDDLARTFAEIFTALYGKVAQQRPVYVELENLFRIVALAQIIKSKYPDLEAKFDLKFLLEDYPVSQTRVDRSLPGRHSLQEVESGDDSQRAYLRLRTCGGVDMAIRVKANQIDHDNTKLVSSLKEGLFRARPSGSSLYWNYPDSAARLSDLTSNLRLQEINSANREALLLTVVYKSSHYEVYAGRSDSLYSGNNISELVKAVNSHPGWGQAKKVYLDMKDFPTKDKVKAFATSCKIQQKKENTGISVEVLARREGSTDSQDALLLPGIRFEKEPSVVEVVKEGEYKGWFKTSLRFVTQVKGVIQRVTITVFAKTAELARAFLDMVGARSTATDFQTKSLSDAINQISREFKLKYGLSDDELSVQYQDQFGDTYIVRLTTPEPNEIA